MDTTASVAPPYVVKPFRLSPFTALMLAPSGVGDPASARAFARPYAEVPGRLREWQNSGRIQRDSTPALYLHEYTAAGVTIRGLVGKLDLSRTSAACPDAQQAVFPHEGVHAEQVSELADRMHEMGINPAPILLVHRGPEALRELVHGILSSPPDWSFSDRAEQLHRMWALRDPGLLAGIAVELSDTRALIADGHHRYAAYLRLQEASPGSPWDHGLAMLVDQSDTPLWLGPIHRFLPGRRLVDVVAACEGNPDLDCRLTSRNEALDRLGDRTLVLTDDEDWATLTLPASDPLAVMALDNLLLPFLGVDKRTVSFHHTAESALAQARAHAGTCILMPIPAFDAVADAAGAGILLPEKATSFQPKPSLGVLMRSLHDG
ncbi:conserved hypothetical protein [metagenome]|uniref:DUF1015 domain-containing protein n=1 Tax=metagenome TaxID=256318 RepID=A0A2P2CAM4_9ZZZZ